MKSPSSVPAWLWPAIPALAALLALRGVFTTSNIFYVRDLCLAFWPMHLWYRGAIFSGTIPLWDPYVAFGQSAVADPLRLILFPPVAALRLLLPEVVGFNLSVALPFPVAALGMYAFSRRTASAPAACLGALAFALSGPVLSTGNFINLSWSIACAPWVLWTTERLARRVTTYRFIAVALVVAAQVLAGEPVTLAATAALALVFAAVAGAERDAGWRTGFGASAATLGALVCGGLLAAAQILPLVDASSRSVRAEGAAAIDTSQWLMHAYTLAETLAPTLFGDYFTPGASVSPWLSAFNGGRYPFLFSVYLGVTVLPLAVRGLFASAPRWSMFWGSAIVIAFVCALGDQTPLYPTLVKIAPVLERFRFPVKYVLFATLGLSVLATRGWDSLRDEQANGASRHAATITAAVIAIAGAAIGTFAALAPDAATNVAASLARSIRVDATDSAAHMLVSATATAGARMAALAVAAAVLLVIAVSKHEAAPRVRLLLVALVAADLFSAGAGLNPTLDATLFSEPTWAAIVRRSASDRVYVARPQLESDARIAGIEGDVEKVSVVAMSAAIGTRSVPFPSAWAVRDSVSPDLTMLWPRNYTLASEYFSGAPRADRERFLARAGVRYFASPASPLAPAREVSAFGNDSSMRLYELEQPAARVTVATHATVEPDVRKQIPALFSSALDSPATVLLEAEPPPPSGTPGEPHPPSARLVRDTAGTVETEATAPEGGGYVVLADSYDPYWVVEVDGVRAPLLRANALYRAVRVEQGAHRVRLAYRPTPFYVGLAISAISALVLMTATVAARRRPR